MAELALYRKYRSHTFDEVVGQDTIVATLRQAVASDRLSHAYLFTGPRGVGKTTLARLLARAANCQGPDANARPCGKCAYCQMATVTPLDIIEIDAASNRGIDEIRDLRAKIALAPSQGRFKVYIIDEVHMLTEAAFNALLKTLEEPPPHVIFILATTEAHKLPETIISRAQRFNFRPITSPDLVRHLTFIATEEKIAIAEETIGLIASVSQGGFRDAISLLDQAAATGQTVTSELIQRLLGWADTTAIDRMSTAIVERRPAVALSELDAMVLAGAQIGQIALQTVTRWRALLRLMSGEPAAADTTLERWQEQLTLPRLLELVDGLVAVGRSPWPEVALEAAIVRLSLPAVATPALADSAAVIETTPSSPDNDPGTELWPKALSEIKQRNHSLYALLRACGITLGGRDLTITCHFNFHRDRLLEPKNRQIIEQALQRTYGRPLRVRAQVEATRPIAPAADPATELVGSALEILGGEVVDG